MSKVDDELTRRLRAAERPVDGDAVFDALARRRSHRQRVRRVQGGLLAFAVLAATAAGFVALRDAFGENGLAVGESPVLAANGEIVFSAEGGDGFIHLYAMQPDGSRRRQITDFGTDDTAPAISPDGRTIAFVHQLEEVSPVIATIPIKGGSPTWLTDPHPRTSDPTWSSDGEEIAFTAMDGDTQRIFVMGADGSDPRPITGDDVYLPEDPAWSPDGTQIAFRGSPTPPLAPEGPSAWDVYLVEPNGQDVRNITSSAALESQPTWSPDGRQIAYVRTGAADGPQIFLRRLSDGAETALTQGPALSSSPAWSPDGRSIVFDRQPRVNGQYDLWRIRPDGSELTRLTNDGAFSAAWQPLPAGSVPPSPAREPSPSTSPSTADADIGLDFRLCHMSRLKGVDLLGDGAFGNAWVGTRVSEDGSCPAQVAPKAVVAVDFNGDEIADSWWGGIEFCLFCEPADAVDLDADGDEELIVVESRSSTPSFLVLTAVRDPDGRPQLRPVVVAGPGHEAAGLIPGEPLRISVGGDEGYSAWVRCENFPAAPVLILTWRDHPIEGNTMDIHETRLVLDDDVASVVGAADDTAPVGSDIPGVSEAPACGVDWLVWD